MKACQVINDCEEKDEGEREKINWDRFLKFYFSKIEESEISYEQILSASVS